MHLGNGMGTVLTGLWHGGAHPWREEVLYDISTSAHLVLILCTSGKFQDITNLLNFLLFLMFLLFAFPL